MPAENKKTILIIEDEAFLADMYKLKFESEGYRVILADDGEKGLGLALKESPDLILLDLMLPKMDGYEVLNRLRADRKGKSLKVFILSNLGQSNEVKRGIGLGADGYFIKSSMTPTQLATEVTKAFKNTPARPVSQKTADKPVAKRKIAGIKTEVAPIEKTPTLPKTVPHILLVEDNEQLVEMYSTLFNKEGFIFDIARNGAWGIKLAKQNEYSIIVLDMVMPAKDGLSVIKELRLNKDRATLPILVLSNSAQDQDVIRAKKAGANAFLIKSKTTPKDIILEINKLTSSL